MTAAELASKAVDEAQTAYREAIRTSALGLVHMLRAATFGAADWYWQPPTAIGAITPAAGWTADRTAVDAVNSRVRRFDIEHTFRMLKQTLGWTTPKLHSPHAADRRTRLLIIAHTQLRLACDLTEDLRRPWEKPHPAQRLSPARACRSFGTYAHNSLAQPVFRNRPAPAPDAPPGHPTTGRHDVHTATGTNKGNPRVPSA